MVNRCCSSETKKNPKTGEENFKQLTDSPQKSVGRALCMTQEFSKSTFSCRNRTTENVAYLKLVYRAFELIVNLLSPQQSVEPPGLSKPNLLSGCLWRKRPKTGPVENLVLPPVDTHNYCSISHASCGPTELDLEQERGERDGQDDNQDEHPPVRMGCEVMDLSNGRTHTALRPMSLSHINPRFRTLHAREKKATQMLAIVLGEWRRLIPLE